MSARVHNKNNELQDRRYARHARSQAPALFVVALVISFRGLVQLLSISTLLPGTRARYPGYVEPERNADDGSGEKNEPIGLDRTSLAGNRETHARESAPPGRSIPLENAQVHDIGEGRLFAVERG